MPTRLSAIVPVTLESSPSHPYDRSLFSADESSKAGFPKSMINSAGEGTTPNFKNKRINFGGMMSEIRD
ncbi:DUF1446 domain protein [Aspergillus luchuensis]|uniref:DUF1446 domain protein n=1 Tax=Aspergillus kawachii TaxID=1069201 RepID=A0A146FLR6_ASPKA|nr:DUF1446 domain protein [Aspergillus luchuensis]